MIKYFVWVNGLRGPEPQIWDVKNITVDGKPIKTLFKQELHPSEHLLGLNELAKRYPFEAKI